MSSVSPNMPTLPLNAGSNRSVTLVISRPVSAGSYPIPVIPDMYGIEYVLPGSYAGSLYFSAAFAAKLGSCSWSSGIR